MSPDNTEPQTNSPEPVDLPTDEDRILLNSGYTVGVKEDGGLFFQLHGEKKGTIELLGLNALAAKQINALVDANLNQGNPEVLQGLNAVYKKLQEVDEKLPSLPEPNNALKLDT